VRFFGENIEYWMGKSSFEITSAVRVLESIEAREMRQAIMVSSFSETKKDHQQKISRDLARSENLMFEEKKQISNRELAKLLGAK